MHSLRDGINLYYRALDNGHDHWLIVTHGIGEHSGRYSFIERLLAQHYNILFYDLRGHGKSGGKRAYARSINQYVDDLEEMIELVLSFGAKSYTLFGHSMGALITSCLIKRKKDLKAKKVFLSSPPVGLPGLLGKIVGVIPNIIFKILEKIPLSIPLKGMVDINYLSHDRKVIDSYVSDPENLLALHSRLLISLVTQSKSVFSNNLEGVFPLFCAVGSADGIVNSKKVVDFFSRQSDLLVVDGAFHELHNEIECYQQEYFDFLIRALVP